MAGFAPSQRLVASDSSDQYLVEAQLWLGGVERPVPALVIGAHEPALLMPVEGPESSGPSWQLEITVEPVDDPFAPSDALWLNVRLSEPGESGWVPLVDSVLGVPEGETATFSVIGDDASEASPETAEVYLRLRTARLRPASED